MKTLLWIIFILSVAVAGGSATLTQTSIQAKIALGPMVDAATLAVYDSQMQTYFVQMIIAAIVAVASGYYLFYRGSE